MAQVPSVCAGAGLLAEGAGGSTTRGVETDAGIGVDRGATLASGMASASRRDSRAAVVEWAAVAGRAASVTGAGGA